MEISARRGIRIGLKRYALVVNSGVRVSSIGEKRGSQGKIKGRCAALPIAVHNVQFIRRYAGKQRAEISRPCASLLIIPPSPPVVNSSLRSS